MKNRIYYENILKQKYVEWIAFVNYTKTLADIFFVPIKENHIVFNTVMEYLLSIFLIFKYLKWKKLWIIIQCPIQIILRMWSSGYD